MKQITICGIPYKIVPTEDVFDVDTHLGQINYITGEIRVNKRLQGEILYETLAHEIIHGILMYLGYEKESQDEQFVQALGNAINQTFTIKGMENE